MNKRYLGMLLVTVVIIGGGTYLGYSWVFLLLPLLCVFGCCFPMMSSCKHSLSKEDRNKETTDKKDENKKCCH